MSDSLGAAWTSLQAFATRGDAALAALSGAIAALIVGLLLAALRRGARRRKAAEARQSALLDAMTRSAEANAAALAELRGRLAAVAELGEARQTEFAAALNQRLEAVGDRLAGSLAAATEQLGQGVGLSLADASRRTADQLGDLRERLAVLDRAEAQMLELSGGVLSLRAILSDKQARGAYGQGRMEAIVADALPRGAYDFQATLSNGKRPDCLIRLPGASASLAIDAKFPLEAFEAMRLAPNAAAESAAAGAARGAILKHIDDISGKYLIAGETQDMALMFVPSESVYADINERLPEAVEAAHRARVLIVSPNMLMLAVQTMQAILRDERMREQAGLIRREVGALVGEVEKLAERARELERHYAAGAKDVERLRATAERIAAHGARIEDADLEERSQKEPAKLAAAE